MASYAKAIADGADFVEPDLVPTKDGVLVARHECNITDTTDVARKPDFAGRRTTRTIDGMTATGWFTIDFTLAELKTLRARERLPQIRPRNTAYDGMFDIPSFEEIIDMVAAVSAACGREVGLIPELKSTPFLRSVGLPTEDLLVRTVAAHGYTSRAPLEIQCFYGDSLRMVRDRIGRSHANIRLMQLLASASIRFPSGSGNGASTGFAEMMSPKGLADIAGYADVVGPDTRSVIPLGFGRASRRSNQSGARRACGGPAGASIHFQAGEPVPRGGVPQRCRSRQPEPFGIDRGDPALPRGWHRRLLYR